MKSKNSYFDTRLQRYLKGFPYYFDTTEVQLFLALSLWLGGWMVEKPKDYPRQQVLRSTPQQDSFVKFGECKKLIDRICGNITIGPLRAT